MIHYVLLHVQNVLQQSDCTSYLGSYEIAAFYERTRSFKQLKSCLNLIATVFCSSQIRWIALRVYKLTSNGFFCSVNHLSGGGVYANHNVTHSPGLARKNKTENDSRLLKNSEGNRDDEWTFCRGQGADIALFLKKTRIGKIRKIFVEN